MPSRPGRRQKESWMLRRTAMAITIVCTALLTLATAASAQSYPTGVLGSNNTQPAPGQTITLTGSNCPPNSAVAFAIDGQPAGGTTSDANGNFTGTATAPTTPGTHNVTATS